jgi:D-alanyl-D-alanine carboxypeptidase (penicillin-binding protein 5/6)
MKKSILISLVLTVCLLWGSFSVPAFAAGDGMSCHGLKADTALDSPGKQLDTAKAVILYELNSGTMVYTYNADQQINPTGLVKFLTVLLALEHGDLNEVVTVKQATLNTVAVGSKSARLKAGEEITLRDLLYCVMVYSANDACAVIAAHIGGNQEGFVTMMNDKAKALGCTNSHFTNAHGLTDAAQYSTPRDLAIVTAAALENETFSEMFSMLSCTIPATNKSDIREYTTTNNMMREKDKNYDSRVTGGKPAAASNTDRSMICTAQVGTARYLCVVMGAKAQMSEDNMVILRYGIFEEMTALINYARDHFELRQILDDSQSLYRYTVENGENGVSLRPSKDVFVVLPLDCDPDMLHFDHRIDQKLAAPVSIGQRLGTLTVYYGHLVMGNCDLVAMHAVAGQGTSIQDADRIEIVPWQEDGFWKTLLSYAAFILLGAVVLYLLIRGLINAVRNAKSRKAQRKKAKQRKRSRR